MNKYLPNSSLLDISAFSKMFKNTTNSYKYLFFLAVLARLSNPKNQSESLNNEIKLIDIAAEMLLIAWFPHNYFKLSFGIQDQFASILNKFLYLQENKIDERSISKSSIDRLRINLYDWLSQNTNSLRLMLKYVPYRLLTAFFEKELRGLLDTKKNHKIKELSEDYFDEKKPLYKFCNESIFIHKQWLEYINNNASITDIQTIIEQNLIDHIPENEKYVSSLPVYPLEIAAGDFADSEIDEYSKQWIYINKIGLTKTLDKDMFISQIHGHSMEPLIPDGSYCLFKYGVVGSRNNRIVLVKKSGYEDHDTQASFTIKRYHSQKIASSEFEWGHKKIELRPENKIYPILNIEPNEADDFIVIAEFIQVI